jgi:hypothetical protein
MSYIYSARKNKHPKVQFEQYLNSEDEPEEHIYSYLPMEFEGDVLSSSYIGRRQLRNTARKLRNLTFHRH